MADPFQDVDAGGSDFLKIVVNALENRAAEPQMVPVIERYLDYLNWSGGSVNIEVGCGSGAIARRMGARVQNGLVIGIDPSEGLISSAKELARTDESSHVKFEVGDGAALRFDDESVDGVVMHTVLSHAPEPVILLREAMRVLKHGGRLVVCDADFEKTCLGNFEGDPLDSCARYFVRNFVTQPYLISELRKTIASIGLVTDEFFVDSRAITDTDGGLAWIRMGTGQMVERGLIGEPLAIALADEYVRRKDLGILYGHQPFGTLIVTKGG